MHPGGVSVHDSGKGRGQESRKLARPRSMDAGHARLPAQAEARRVAHTWRRRLLLRGGNLGGGAAYLHAQRGRYDEIVEH